MWDIVQFLNSTHTKLLAKCLVFALNEGLIIIKLSSCGLTGFKNLYVVTQIHIYFTS